MAAFDQELIIGSDFGAPASAGQQAKKIILVEAQRLGDGSYLVDASGRNERLIRVWEPRGPWQDRRRGWTVPELAESLAGDAAVTVAAFDFPFSIPLSLLNDVEFSQLVGADVFRTRTAWATFVGRHLKLSFSSDRAMGRMNDLEAFRGWREKRFWKKRMTDAATNGSPPLKHMFQNVFSMTLAGVAMLEQLRSNGVLLALSNALMPIGKRVAFETYPAAVARHCGFQGNYKQSPAACMAAAEKYLADRGITLTVAESVRQFCLEYSTAGKNKDDRDPDGADAFLCLVAAICFREMQVELCDGGALPAVLEDEGCIIVPNRTL